MNAFYEHHKDSSIEFGYRCFDRLLLNGLIQPKDGSSHYRLRGKVVDTVQHGRRTRVGCCSPAG